jgi:hypothetical protein
MTQAAMTTWAARHLPARLDVAATAKLLGFAEHDIQILMAVGKLTPLGDPAANAPRWFAAVEMIRLAADQDWLHKATKDIGELNVSGASFLRGHRPQIKVLKYGKSDAAVQSLLAPETETRNRCQ